MARAYICLARADIEDSMLQVLDLKPNSSQRVPAYDGAGQTAYLPFAAQNSTVAHTDVGGVLTASAAYNGLAAYICARVDDVNGVGGHGCVSAANANTIATAILARLVAGSALTSAGINTAIQVTLDDTGIGLGHSTATAAEILRICQGEVFQVASGAAFSGAAGAFLGTAGGFLASTATGYRNIKTFTDTGSLRLSCGSGHLFVLSQATFSWNNPSLTYGSGGTALFVDATEVPATHLGRAVSVYDASGNVLA